MKVLVIEDEPLIRDIYAEFLELLGHEADVTAEGREGRARFDPLLHKLVITDFLSPMPPSKARTARDHPGPRSSTWLNVKPTL